MKEGTILAAFREDLYPRRKTIVPAWFASARQVEELPTLHGGPAPSKAQQAAMPAQLVVCSAQ